MYLDIYKIADLYSKKETGWETQIASIVMDCYDQSKQKINENAKQWQENVLFWQGEHYLEYNNTISQYEPIEDDEFTFFIPRPKDNLMVSPVNTMVSMLIQNKPIAEVIQNSDTAQDKNRARLAEALESAKWEIDKEQANYKRAAQIATLCQNVYRKDYWDTSGTQTVAVSMVDDNGIETTVEAPLGDNAVKILSPFDIVPDLKNAITHLDDGMFIMEDQDHPVEYIKNQYKAKKKEGYTGLAEDIKPSQDKRITFSYIEELQGTEEIKGEYATVIECYTRPVEKAPKGLKLVVCNGLLLYAFPSIYTYEDGTNWHPYTMFRYEDHPLRHYGTCLMDHIVPLQKRYNSMLALEALTRQTMAIPQWLIPNGSMSGEPSGEPGECLYYDSVNGERPTRIDGKGLHPSAYKEKDNCEQKIQYIAGTNDVLQGQRPQGVSTATELNILLEQSMSVHSPKIQAWEKFISESQGKKLNLIRMKYKEPRRTLINRIKALNAGNRDVEINDYFTGKELGDNIDVRIEAGSSLPKLKSAQRAAYIEALDKGLLGDLSPMGNPIGNKKILSKLGVEKFPTENDEDLTRAEWENDLIRQGLMDDIKVLPTDNQLLHFKTIITEVNRPEFIKSNSEDIIALYNKHAMEHWAMMEDQEKVQAVGQKRALIIEQSQNIYGENYGLPPQPVIEERVVSLERQVASLGQFAEQASQMMGVTPNPGVTATAPANTGVGVAQNIPPGMA